MEDAALSGPYEQRTTRPPLATSTWRFPPTNPTSHADAGDDSSESVTPEPRGVSPLARSASYGLGLQDPGEVHNAGDGLSLLSSSSQEDIASSLPSSGIQSPSAKLGFNMDGLSPELRDQIRFMVQQEVGQHLKNPIDSSAGSDIPHPCSSPAPGTAISVASKTSAQSTPAQQCSPSLSSATVQPISIPDSTKSPLANTPLPRLNVRFSNRHNKPIIHGGSRSPSSSPTPPALGSGIEPSAVDLRWGHLVDPTTGQPTRRLGQFLRGLANHINAEFATPTMVVTPIKLALFYAKFRTSTDAFSYSGIFRETSKVAMDRLADLYLDLGCEFHLVQSDVKSKPNIPGLTPAGFEKWLRTNIYAYPDQEARRLATVITELPVDADGPLMDGKPERLPKQLSRHLLPAVHDENTRKTLKAAIEDFLEELEFATSPSSPYLRAATTSSVPQSPSQVHARKTPASAAGKRRSESTPSSQRPALNESRIALALPEKYSEPSMERRPSYRHRSSSSRTYSRSDVRVEPARTTRPSMDRSASARVSSQDLPPPPIGRSSSSYQRTRSPPPTRGWATDSMPANIQAARAPSVSSPSAIGHGKSWSATSSSAQLTPSSSFNSMSGNHFELSTARAGGERKTSAGAIGVSGNGASFDDYNTRYSPRSSRQDLDSSTPRPMAPPASVVPAGNRRSLVIPTTPGGGMGPTYDDLYRGSPISPRGLSSERTSSHR